MFCPQCGAPNEDDAIFCGNCGAVLKPEELPVEATRESAAVTSSQEPDEEEMLYEEMVPDQSLSRPELPVAPPPPPPPPPPPRPRPPVQASSGIPTSGMAIASLLLGIGGLTILPLLGSILAVFLGYMARSEIRRRPNSLGGDGLATAGIVLGWVSIGLAVLGLVLFGAFAVCGFCGALSAGNY